MSAHTFDQASAYGKPKADAGPSGPTRLVDDLKEAIKNRKSIREYEDKPVPEDKLLRVLEAARLAPSGANRQDWKFIIVRDSKRRQELAKASGGQPQVAQAPVVIAAVATVPDVIMRCGVPGYAVDLAIAVDHITLAAVD